MRTTTQTFKRIMASGSARKYLVKIDLTLADNTVLHLTEADIWDNTFKIETASSGTSSFDIGSAVIGKCSFSINNFDERFNQYDFFNASAVVWVGLVGDIDNNDTQVYYRMGFYTVDEPVYASSLITLELLDNMWKFDTPLSAVNLTYPITIKNAFVAICQYCGVTLGTQTFHGDSFTIEAAPEKDMNCREFLQYMAMIGCNFLTISDTGALLVKWYNTSAIPSGTDIDGGTFDTNTTPYSDGANLNGGTFAFNDGDTADGGTFTDNSDCVWFTRNMQATFGTDVITITGVKFTINDTAYTIGTAGYMLELENPIVNANNVNTVLNLIWDVLNGFSLRTYNITTISDLSAEVGDCCILKDYKGNFFYSWITLNSFGFSNHVVQCNAVTPQRQLAKRYSKTVAAAVAESRKATEQIISDYDVAVQLMNDVAVNAMGGYVNYEDLPTGGRVYYLSNMPITKSGNTCSFQSGSTVFKRTGDGLFVSTNGGQTWQNGYDAQTGQLIVNVLNAIGISADWIKTGTLDADLITAGRIRDRYNYNYWDLDSGEFKLAALPAGTGISDPNAPNSGAYVPTNNNLPASGWTDEQKKQHVGETFYNTSNKKTYIYKGSTIFETAHPYPAGVTNNYYHVSVPKDSYGAYIQFDSRSATETNWDYIDIYKRNYQGNYYKARFTGSIGQKYFSIDGYTYGTTNDIWVVWTTDGTVTDWGWRIDVVDTPQGTDASSSFSADTLPSYSWTNITWGDIVSYDWVEASLEEYVGAKAEFSQPDLTQEEIFDILTDHQQNQGLFLSGNKLYINGEMFATNALMIGKNPNTGYEPYLQIFANDGTTEIGRWDKNGIEATAGKFGKLHVFTDTSDVTYLKYVTSGNRVYLDQSWSAGHITDYNRKINLVINPFREGWQTDGKINVAFSMPVGSSSSRRTDTQCTIRVYKYSSNGRTIEKTVQLRYDGYTSGGYYGLDYTFDHNYGSNAGETYLLRFEVVKRSASYTQNSSTTLTVNDNGLGSGFVVREGSDHRAVCTGRFQGEFKGDATLDNLQVGEYITCSSDDITTAYTDDPSFLMGSSVRPDGIRVWSGTTDWGDSTEMLYVYTDDIKRESGGTDYWAQWSTSDERVKEDIEDLDHELSRKLIDGTRTREFTFKGASGRNYGMIAQETRALLDSLGEEDSKLEYIAGRPDGKIPNQRNIDYPQYIPHLINYVKDLRSEIDGLKAEIKALKGE